MVAIIPKTANATGGLVRSPNPTNVAGLSTTIPAFWKPINAMKKPIPAPIANFNCFGSYHDGYYAGF